MSTEPVEDHLDELLRRLPGDARSVRRTLHEAEAHLLDAAAAHEATGLDRLEAERRAVADFGSACEVADAFRTLRVRDLLRPAVLLAAVGLVAVGVSGLVAELMGRALSPGFVSGDPPGVTYTAGRCAELREYAPSGASCTSAAAFHHWGEVVQYRVAAGVLGLLLIGLWALLPRGRRLPAAVTATLGTILFGSATATLLLASLSTVGTGGRGLGQWLSAALVALVLTGPYATRMARHVSLPRLVRGGA